MSRGRVFSKVGGLTQTVSGISTFVGISTFGSDVRIHGNTVIDGTTTSTGNHTFSSNVGITGTLDVDGATTVDGLTVAELGTFSAGINVTGTITLQGTSTTQAIKPQADSTYDIGTTSIRYRAGYFDDVYCGDLNMSNEHRGGNSIDGSWGSYQIEEGENDLFIVNKRSGKKFRFVMEQV